MKDGIKIYKKTILKLFLKLKMPEYLIYAPFESIYHTVHNVILLSDTRVDNENYLTSAQVM